jgi:hypothetical protein
MQQGLTATCKDCGLAKRKGRLRASGAHREVGPVRALRGCDAAGVGRDLAAQTAGSPHGPWRLSNSPALTMAPPNAFFFGSLGVATLAPQHAA